MDRIKISIRLFLSRGLSFTALLFACSGSLTVASWNKLGRDLDRKHEEGDLRLGTKAIWKLIKNCLEDETCRPAIVEGQGVFNYSGGKKDLALSCNS